MIIIFVIIVALSRLKQEITSHHLKDCAGERPDVSRGIVVGTYNDLWRPILTSLDFRSKVMVSPATVTHVAYLYHHVLINLGTSLTLTDSGLLSSSPVELFIIIKKVPYLLLPSSGIHAGLLCLPLLLGWIFISYLLGRDLFFLLGLLCATLVLVGSALLVDLGLLLLSLLLLLLVLALLGCEAIIQVGGSFFLLGLYLRGCLWFGGSCGCWRCFSLG